MSKLTEFVKPSTSEDFIELANVTSKRTGLPLVVWISPQAGAPHDVRVKVSRGPKVLSSELISVAIRPEVRVVGGGELDGRDMAFLQKWVELNRDVIVQYRDGEIEDTADAIAALKPIP